MTDSVARVAETPCLSVGHGLRAWLSVLFGAPLAPPILFSEIGFCVPSCSYYIYRRTDRKSQGHPERGGI